MMIEIQVVISPQQVAQQLFRFEAAMTPEIDAVVRDTALAIREEAATYEPPPTPSYRRTGYMAQMTVYQQTAPGAYMVEMRAPYSKYVRGVAGGAKQAWMHAGRWHLFQQIVDAQTGKKLVAAIVNAIERAKQKAGL